MTEIHTLDEMGLDPGGWDVATCTCGWFTPGCPDVDTAFEVLCAHINDARDAEWEEAVSVIEAAHDAEMARLQAEVNTLRADVAKWQAANHPLRNRGAQP